MSTFTFCICIIIVLLKSSLGQRRTVNDVSTVNDVISELPTTPQLLLAETVSVPVKTQCSLHCLRRPWCQYFAVCSTTSSSKHCHLFKEDETSPVTPFKEPGCSFYKATSTKPVVLDDVTTTAVSSTASSGSETSHAESGANPSATPSTTTQNTSRETHNYPDCSTMYSSLLDLSTMTPIGTENQDPCINGRVIIQRRSSSCPRGFFNRSWSEYESGFVDNLGVCFWLGNAKIRTITGQSGSGYQLVITLRLGSNFKTVAYSDFKLERAENKYKLQYKEFYDHDYDGNGEKMEDGFGAGDFGSSYELNGKEFYTHDRDSQNACASQTGSGWWFNNGCAKGNLNHEDGPQWLSDSSTMTTYDWSQMGIAVSDRMDGW